LATIIKDFKVRPLDREFSTGFIQSGPFIINWLKNNNQNLTNEQIEEIERKYLIPYNSTKKNIYL